MEFLVKTAGGLAALKKFTNTLGALTSSLGLIGGALSFATALIEGDPVMGKLEKIEKQISGLEMAVKSSFSKTWDHIEQVACRTQLMSKVNVISHGYDSMKVYVSDKGA